MSTHLSKAFFKAFFNCFSDGPSILGTDQEALSRREHSALSRSISTLMLNAYLSALEKVLKQYIAGQDSAKKSKSSPALHYAQNSATGDVAQAEKALLADVQKIWETSRQQNEHKIMASIQYTTLRDGVQALVKKLETAEALDEVELKEDGKTPYLLSKPKKNVERSDDSETLPAAKTIAAFGEHALDLLAFMNDMSKEDFLNWNPQLITAATIYGYKVLDSLKEKAEELSPEKQFSCTIM